MFYRCPKSSLKAHVAGLTSGLSSRVLFLMFLLAPHRALAQAGTGGGYQPYVPAAGAHEVSAPLFVVLAYSAIWLVLLSFIISVWRRQRKVEAELESLRQQLGGQP